MPLEDTEEGLQLREDTVGIPVTVMVPPEPVMRIPRPEGDEPTGLGRPITVPLAEEERVTLTIAAMPLAMKLALAPESTQV